MNNFEIWTDGGCAPTNPGPGGYGIIIVDNATGEEKEIKQGFKYTTNNRMELLAVIRALNEIPKEASVKLHTDSKYVVLHVNENQKRNKNYDLWKLLDEAMEGRSAANIDWVDAHNRRKKDVLHINNNRCHALVDEARKAELIVDEGYNQP